MSKPKSDDSTLMLAAIALILAKACARHHPRLDDVLTDLRNETERQIAQLLPESVISDPQLAALERYRNGLLRQLGAA